MDIRPVECFDPDELCSFELFSLSKATMVPIMLTMTPTVEVQPKLAVHVAMPSGIATNAMESPKPIPNNSSFLITAHQKNVLEYPSHVKAIGSGIDHGRILSKNFPPSHSVCKHVHQQYRDKKSEYLLTQSQAEAHQPNIQTPKFMDITTPSSVPGYMVNDTGGVSSGSGKNGGCGVGCNALMMMGIVGGSGGGVCSGDSAATDHPKQPCTCTYMNFDNFSDYQTTGFGGLPDVTEHSNLRRNTILHQDSISNSESVDGSTMPKPNKMTQQKTSNRKYFLLTLPIVAILVTCIVVSIMTYNFFLLKPQRNSYDQRLKIVEQVLQEVPLIDGHNDLPWNVRKFAHGSLELLDIAHDLRHESAWPKSVWLQTDIPRMKRGLLGAQIWAAYVPCDAQGLDAVQLALEQIDIIYRFTELHPKEFVLAISSQDILISHRNGILASLIGVEGGHAISSSLGVLRSFYSLGARYLTLTHQCDTSWAGSSFTNTEKGLNAFGKAVVKEMNRLGMLIDLSHSSDATVRDVLEITRAPVIFSHSVARSLCNYTRNIPDDTLRAVADNGGIIMISFASQHVACSDSSTLQDVVDHIKHVRYIAGMQHIGIGAGYDGIETPPKGLEDVSKYPNLFSKLLEDENWSEEDIAMLAGKNFIRVLKSVENVRDYWKRAAIQPVELVEQTIKTQCSYIAS